MSGGGFAAVWEVETGDGRHLVLKVAPPAGARLLRYEANLLAAEAAYFRRLHKDAPSVPVPVVVACDTEALLMTRLPGEALTAYEESMDTDASRDGLGRVMTQVHQLQGDRFGYTGDRPSGRSWPDAYRAIVEALLADAETFSVALQDVPRRVRRAVDAAANALACVTRPTVVHFDLWDGNVLATVDGDGVPRMTGLVDGERWLCGDPLIDFVSPALFRRIEDEPHGPFVSGYRAAAGVDPLDWPAAAERLALSRLWLALLMVVEMPSRAMTGPEHAQWESFLRQQLEERLKELGG